MCWQCVSGSAPFVLGSAVVVRAYGAKLKRDRLRGEAEPIRPPSPKDAPSTSPASPTPR